MFFFLESVPKRFTIHTPVFSQQLLYVQCKKPHFCLLDI
ncbi:hypothetical protein BN2497_13417 [Janthinobacterium sp. CG23_2]|nr:hypothetical protein BN2497_13417 [Janthinobacterium sp. CG23_2]CUU33106.1 hypothetical protein BN3177_13417 [Janthinobacterium sp. CG23_2]